MPILSQAEQTRRLDITQPGVAKEALDVLAEIEARHGSSSEVFTAHGYSPKAVAEAAIREERRVIAELAVKPSKDVLSTAFSAVEVKEIQTKYAIAEVAVKDPVDLEPVIVPK